MQVELENGPKRITLRSDDARDCVLLGRLAQITGETANQCEGGAYELQVSVASLLNAVLGRNCV